ncbi:hypothetical protein YC2023_041721 [Brassica napus]
MLPWRSETYTPDQDRAVAQGTEHRKRKRRKGGRGKARGKKRRERGGRPARGSGGAPPATLTKGFRVSFL